MSTKIREFMDGHLSADEEETLLREDPALAMRVRASMYVDGELTVEDAAAFEAEMTRSPALLAEVESLTLLVGVMSQGPEDPGAAEPEAGPSASATPRAPSNEPAPRGSRSPGRGPAHERHRPFRRARGRWAAGLTAVAASVVAALVAVPMMLVERAPSGLEIEILFVEGTERRTRVGDRLRLAVPMKAGLHQALRLYHSSYSVPVVDCPGAEACFEQAGRMGLETTLDTRGTYEILWMSSTAPLPPSAGNADADAAALDGDAKVIEFRKIDVR